jgi:glycoprotein-N-acetylgalactosamine 3-beta-galactosyltransferase
LAGYTLNKAALKILVVRGFPLQYQNIRDSAEDLFVARTLYNLGVLPYPTADEHNGQRYHHFTPGQYYANDMPGWVKSGIYTQGMNEIEGHNHSAVHSVAFHEVKSPMLMRRLHAIMYNLCPTTAAAVAP